MDFEKDCDTYQIHAFWSREIAELMEGFKSHKGRDYAGQHDLVLGFVNDALFGGKGEFNREFRVKGNKYPDLKIPVEDAERGFEIVELKVHTSELKYLRGELNKREKIFSTSDRLYFGFLWRVGSKEEGKVILDRMCIYYLVIIKISKQTLTIPINELIGDIKMGTKHFAEELKEKSGIDEEKEELLGVDNIFKVVDLERELTIRDLKLEEKEKKIGEKDQIIEEKDHLLEEKEVELEEERKLRKVETKLLKEKDKQLNQKEKQLDQKDKEIERLKAQLKDK